MCGLPCAGKTTLAKQIERERSAVRLTPDEWLVGLLGNDIPFPQLVALRDPIEALLWELAERLLGLGVDVVVDFGVWSRSERDEFRARAARLGARSELHFLDVPLDVLLARLAVRNATLPPGTFPIEAEKVALWSTWFERPAADELVACE